jgi:hypothetical protein
MIGLLLKKLLATVLPYTSFWNSDYIISILKQQLFNSFCKTQTKTLPYHCECDSTELEWYKSYYNSMNYFYFFAYTSILAVIFTGFFIQVDYIRSTRSTRSTRKTQNTQEEKAKTPILNKVLKDLDELNKNREMLEINQSKKRKFLETIQESLQEQEPRQEPLDLEFVTIDL